MYGGDVSDYSDLTAGQYEGKVLKRERHYKWRSYWCVLYGRQLTFYDDSKKNRVAGRIEIQPGSRCDKEKGKSKFPSLAEIFHREYSKTKKYPLQLKTKKGTHLFTYEDVKEQSRWQMAMNNASQVNASGVRLSWIPTPFSMVTTPNIESKRSSRSPAEPSPPSSPDRNANGARDSEGLQLGMISVVSILPKSSKSKHDDTRTLIPESDSPDSELAFTNPSVHMNIKEFVTSL